MTDLHTDYLGMRLRSPIVASPSPLTGELDSIVELERHGAGAIVLPSIFEEQIEHEANEIDRLLSVHSESFGEATDFLPDVDGYNSGIDRYLELVGAAKAAVDVPVIASLNGASIGGWLRYGSLLEDAGADAVEVNLYTVAADPIVSSSTLESEQFGLIAILADELNIPLAVKISPFYSSLASFLVAVQEAGAAGVVMFNRFYQPDLDLETLGVAPRLSLSSPEELRLPLRWTGIMREHLSMSIAASTGVHSGFDVAKLVLVGADVAMATSSLLRNGASHIATMEEQLRDWMVEHDYESIDQMRGAVRMEAAADPAAFERANYIGNLASWTSRHFGSHSIGLHSN
jgi:dihydroorotate dehydrogenase (fumarate)